MAREIGGDVMNAGKLRHKMVIQYRTNTRDAAGQRTETWNTLATVFGFIKPLVGRDYVASKQIVDEITHDITIRYLSTVKANMRINYNSRIFEITTILDPDERKRILYLKCKEVVT